MRPDSCIKHSWNLCFLLRELIYSHQLYLSYKLNDEIHHQLGVLVEHALPQLVHHPLGEVEDVVDQDLVAAAAAEGQRGVFTWDGDEDAFKIESHT